MSCFLRYARLVALSCLFAAAGPIGVQAEQIAQAQGDGRDRHAMVVRQFGGAYGDPQLQAYVTAVGERLVRETEMAGRPFTFTVLNSDMINAFAMSGGHVHVTRGMVALLDNEAQLAGVLAHEIAHVTAGHTEGRSSSIFEGIGRLGLGLVGTAASVVDVPLVSDMLVLGAAGMLRSYSRDQEYEADRRGIRYMARAGFAPEEMAGLLAKLNAEQALSAKLQGRGNPAEQYSFLSTHPSTADRQRRAERQSAERGGGRAKPRRGTADYLRAVDGLYVDGDPESGFVKGGRFVHPGLRFAFQVPQGFTIVNQPTAILALGPDRSALRFDIAKRPHGASMPDYIQELWGRKVPLDAIQSFDVGGLEAATCLAQIETRQATFYLRLVALPYGSQYVARFLFLAPAETMQRMDQAFLRTAASYRRLSAEAAARERPLRLRIAEVKAGETVEGFARRMPYPSHQTERFRVLNGLAPGASLAPGRLVKYVRD
ncbi:MAG: M48 family metalloprotease [Alphaproteobacteria bacterium]|nr:M48 family metalloprotease [Alphaproteobacteria bacterium]